MPQWAGAGGRGRKAARLRGRDDRDGRYHCHTGSWRESVTALKQSHARPARLPRHRSESPAPQNPAGAAFRRRRRPAAAMCAASQQRIPLTPRLCQDRRPAGGPRTLRLGVGAVLNRRESGADRAGRLAPRRRFMGRQAAAQPAPRRERERGGRGARRHAGQRHGGRRAAAEGGSRLGAGDGARVEVVEDAHAVLDVLRRRRRRVGCGGTKSTGAPGQGARHPLGIAQRQQEPTDQSPASMAAF